MPEPSFEEKVRILWEERAIMDVMHRYSRGFDRGDLEMVKSAYWPDALEDHHTFCGLSGTMCEVFDELCHDRFESTQHHITNTRIDLDGDTAHVESYCFSMAVLRDTLELDVSGGRYVRRMEKRDGEWRIAAGVLIADWALDADATRALVETGAVGTRDRTDPSYDRPLVVTRARTDLADGADLR
jgi:hypothetical protein